MKYIIKDNNNVVLLETYKKEEVDCFIEENQEYNEFYGFYWENNDMIISTGGFDVIIRYE